MPLRSSNIFHFYLYVIRCNAVKKTVKRVPAKLPDLFSDNMIDWTWQSKGHSFADDYDTSGYMSDISPSSTSIQRLFQNCNESNVNVESPQDATTKDADSSDPLQEPESVEMMGDAERAVVRNSEMNLTTGSPTNGSVKLVHYTINNDGVNMFAKDTSCMSLHASSCSRDMIHSDDPRGPGKIHNGILLLVPDSAFTDNQSKHFSCGTFIVPDDSGIATNFEISVRSVSQEVPNHADTEAEIDSDQSSEAGLFASMLEKQRLDTDKISDQSEDTPLVNHNKYLNNSETSLEKPLDHDAVDSHVGKIESDELNCHNRNESMHMSSSSESLVSFNDISPRYQLSDDSENEDFQSNIVGSDDVYIKEISNDMLTAAGEANERELQIFPQDQDMANDSSHGIDSAGRYDKVSSVLPSTSAKNAELSSDNAFESVEIIPPPPSVNIPMEITGINSPNSPNRNDQISLLNELTNIFEDRGSKEEIVASPNRKLLAAVSRSELYPVGTPPVIPRLVIPHSSDELFSGLNCDSQDSDDTDRSDLMAKMTDSPPKNGNALTFSSRNVNYAPHIESKIEAIISTQGTIQFIMTKLQMLYKDGEKQIKALKSELLQSNSHFSIPSSDSDDLEEPLIPRASKTYLSETVISDVAALATAITVDTINNVVNQDFNPKLNLLNEARIHEEEPVELVIPVVTQSPISNISPFTLRSSVADSDDEFSDDSGPNTPPMLCEVDMPVDNRVDFQHSTPKDYEKHNFRSSPIIRRVSMSSFVQSTRNSMSEYLLASSPTKGQSIVSDASGHTDDVGAKKHATIASRRNSL